MRSRILMGTRILMGFGILKGFGILEIKNLASVRCSSRLLSERIVQLIIRWVGVECPPTKSSATNSSAIRRSAIRRCRLVPGGG